MIGLIWNLSFGEIFVVGALAVMVFGGRLPEVAARVLHAVKRFKRSLDDLKRETGIEQELRNIDFEIRQTERAAHAPVHSPQGSAPGASSSLESGSLDSGPAVEAPPGFRQARRVQGTSPDLAPGATPLAGGEEDRSGLVAPSLDGDEPTDPPAPESRFVAEPQDAGGQANETNPSKERLETEEKGGSDKSVGPAPASE